MRQWQQRGCLKTTDSHNPWTNQRGQVMPVHAFASNAYHISTLAISSDAHDSASLDVQRWIRIRRLVNLNASVGGKSKTNCQVDAISATAVIV
jgi:hypothetical protein